MYFLDGTVQIWNAVNGQQVAKLEGIPGRIIQEVFLPDNTLIFTASQDKRSWVSNAANGQLVAKLDSPTSPFTQAAFSPDGQRIATAGDDNIVAFT